MNLTAPMSKALEMVLAMGHAPNPKAEACARDRRLNRLRDHLDRQLPRLADGQAGVEALFSDLLSARNQRRARIRRLMAARRWQVRGEAKESRVEYLRRAADLRRSEMSLRDLETRQAHARAIADALGVQ